jgi:hypothetical protein
MVSIGESTHCFTRPKCAIAVSVSRPFALTKGTSHALFARLFENGDQSMIPKSGYRFSAKIMLQQ